MSQKSGTLSRSSGGGRAKSSVAVSNIRTDIINATGNEMAAMQRSLAEIETTTGGSLSLKPAVAQSPKLDSSQDIASASWPPAQHSSLLSLNHSESSDEGAGSPQSSSEEDEEIKMNSKLQNAARESIQKTASIKPKTSSSFLAQKAVGAESNEKAPSSPTSRKEYLMRLISLKSSEPKQMPQKSASMDNVHLRNVRPTKSILKKPMNPHQRLLSTLEAQYGGILGGSTSTLPDPISGGAWMTSSGDISRQASQADLQSIASSVENTSANFSAPRRLGSTRSISFNTDDVPVIETYSKSAYNRKPDNNITVKKLTPKLKQEIRDELNEFKKHEMEVHELSASNTAFH